MHQSKVCIRVCAKVCAGPVCASSRSKSVHRSMYRVLVYVAKRVKVRPLVCNRSGHYCIDGKVCARVCAGVCPKYVQILWVCSRACATLWAAVCTRSDRRMQTWPGMHQGMRRGIYKLLLNCALPYARRLCATFPSPLAVEGMRRRYAPDGIRSNKVPFSMPTAFCNWLGMRQGMRRPFSTEGLGFTSFCLSVSPKNRFNRTVCP